MTRQTLPRLLVVAFLSKGVGTPFVNLELFQLAWERRLAGAFGLIINNQCFVPLHHAIRSCRGAPRALPERKRLRYSREEEGGASVDLDNDICSFRLAWNV